MLFQLGQLLLCFHRPYVITFPADFITIETGDLDRRFICFLGFGHLSQGIPSPPIPRQCDPSDCFSQPTSQGS